MKKVSKNPAMSKGGLKGSFPSSNGGSLKTGLSSRETMSSNPDALGMGNTGPNQMPMCGPKDKVGKFQFC